MSNTVYPVFVDGTKVGDATDVSYERDVEIGETVIGPLGAKVFDRRAGERILHQKGSIVTFSVNVPIPADTEITTIEIVIPSESRWRVVELHYPSITEHTRRHTEGVAQSMSETITKNVGPDVDDRSVTVDGDGFDVSLHDGGATSQ